MVVTGKACSAKLETRPKNLLFSPIPNPLKSTQVIQVISMDFGLGIWSSRNSDHMVEDKHMPCALELMCFTGLAVSFLIGNSRILHQATYEYIIRPLSAGLLVVNTCLLVYFSTTRSFLVLIL